MPSICSLRFFSEEQRFVAQVFFAVECVIFITLKCKRMHLDTGPVGELTACWIRGIATLDRRMPANRLDKIN